MPRGKNKPKNEKTVILSEVEKELEEQNLFEDPIKVIVEESAEKKTTKSEDLEELFKPYRETFRHVRQELQQIKSSSQKSLQRLAQLEKDVYKSYRTMARQKNSKPKKKEPRIPTGFAKPSVISEELCDFLGKPYGSEIARTEVTKFMSEYIRKHSLQHHKDKRKIVPDRKLTKLLKLQKNDHLTYFNLQKFMKHHFSTKESNLGEQEQVSS